MRIEKGAYFSGANIAGYITPPNPNSMSPPAGIPVQAMGGRGMGGRMGGVGGPLATAGNGPGRRKLFNFAVFYKLRFLKTIQIKKLKPSD